MAFSGPIREGVTLRPEPHEWLRVVRDAQPPVAGSVVFEMRRELGLPTDQLVLMSGHQVEFWYAGVLAKLVAIDAAWRVESSVHLAWVDVDQDANQPWRIGYPARNAAGELVRRVWDASGGSASEEELALGAVRPIAVVGEPKDAYTPAIAAGLARIGAALRDASNAASAAAQFGDAAFALAGEVGQGVQRISAMALARTSLFAGLVAQMTREPERCCSAYNAAVLANPGAGVRPLEARGELPLWS
ncbi:MAG: hypothetical protein WC718_19515, partial [Phycisphaerales bacterium]